MRKLTFTILTFLSSGILYALPIDNPATPTLFCEGLFHIPECFFTPYVNFRGGFYGDYLYDCKLKNDSLRNHKHLDHSTINTNAGLFVFNFCQRGDLFATVGMSQLEIEGNVSSFTPILQIFNTLEGARLKLETSEGFSWSVGGKVALFQWGCSTLGIEGAYFSSTPKVRQATYGSVASTYYSNTKPYLRASFQEWQLGVALSYQIGRVIPYAGIKWSERRLHWKNRFPSKLLLIDDGAIISLHDMKNTNSLGYAVGATLLDCRALLLTAEARFGNEKALSINAQIRF